MRFDSHGDVRTITLGNYDEAQNEGVGNEKFLHFLLLSASLKEELRSLKLTLLLSTAKAYYYSSSPWLKSTRRERVGGKIEKEMPGWYGTIISCMNHEKERLATF